MEKDEKKYSASVKIMRSYDYNHFECVLSSSEDMDLDEINEMRKGAAILVDESIRQYKIAREREIDQFQKREMINRLNELEVAKSKPPDEITAKEAALLRADADKSFWKDWNKNFYIYQDYDKDKEYHFNMLNKFKNHTVKV